MIVLDSNILIRYCNPKDTAHAVSFAAVTRLQAEGRVLCIVPQNLYEFWATATRLDGSPQGLTVQVSKEKTCVFPFAKYPQGESRNGKGAERPPIPNPGPMPG